MKSLIWTGVMFALCGIASGQAAVEGALTHALSGGTSAAAGKALGQAGNQLSGRLGQQTSNAVAPRVTTVRVGPQKGIKVPQTTTAAAPAANGGSLIASIQGGEAQPEKPCAQKAADKSQNANCGEKKAVNQDSHPSEITLPAPK
jgi:hypothetical protein